MKKYILSLTALFFISVCTNSYGQWNLTGNNNATSASLLGTTNAIPLNLTTNNVQRMVIDANGKIGIGTTTPINILTVKGTGSTPAASWVAAGAPLFVGFGETAIGNADYILSMASTSSNGRPVFVGRRSRGTLAVPTAMANNDFIMSMLASGYDGAAFQNPATIDFFVDGTPTAGNVPARISFVTGSNSGNRAERLKIGNTGDVSINNTQLTITKSTGDVSVGAGNLLVAKNANIKGIVGVNGDTVSGTALYVKADATHNGITVSDPVDKYVLYATKSGTNQGIYISRTSTTSGTGSIAGVSTGTSIGVEAYASLNNGVYAQSDSAAALYGVSNTSFGVYGESADPASYAGYFNGDVFSTGNYSGSDARLKKNIKDFGNAMQIIGTLQPKNYDFKKEGDYALLHLPGGNHYGLIAQDIEKVLPNLVKEAKVYVKGYKKGDLSKDNGYSKGRMVDFKAINYTELIPIMIKGMQEQEEKIKAQEETNQRHETLLKQQNDKIDALIDLVEKLSPGAKNALAISNIKISSATLEQNVPNPPVGNATRIGYNIPEVSAKAELVIADMNGKTVKQLLLTNKGKGLLNIDTAGLSAGTYSYTLLVDGKVIETRKMIVASN